jgi:hypothetical protein
MERTTYIVERLNSLIAEGEIVLRTYNQVGNIDRHDLWFTEAKNFLSVAAPEYLEKLHSVLPKYRGKLLSEPRGRAAYNLIQEQLEVLKLARGQIAESGSLNSYQKLAEPIRMFFQDTVRGCENYEKNVFIMTRFQEGDETLAKIDELIRHTLESRGLVGHRADDRCYPEDRNLWDNVCTYMFGCKYGIAVLEDIIVEEFNPNVALEYGFMRGLGKPTLLLKEKRFPARADILGTIWEEFDILKLQATVPKAINRWLDDIVG